MGQFYQVYYHKVKALLTGYNFNVVSHEDITTPKKKARNISVNKYDSEFQGIYLTATAMSMLVSLPSPLFSLTDFDGNDGITVLWKVCVWAVKREMDVAAMKRASCVFRGRKRTRQ